MADKKTEAETNGTTATAETAKKLSKREAVRLAINDLGKNASRKQLQAHIKTAYGMDISLDHISASKSELDKMARQRSNRRPAPVATEANAPTPQAVPASAAPASPQTSPTPAILLTDILTVKGLVDRIGGESLRTLIAAFER